MSIGLINESGGISLRPRKRRDTLPAIQSVSVQAHECVCVFVGEASMLEALWAVLSGLHAARYVKPRPMMVLGHNGGRASNNEQ